MIEVINAVLTCAVTGFFTALFIVGMSLIGWLPMVIIGKVGDEEDFKD